MLMYSSCASPSKRNDNKTSNAISGMTTKSQIVAYVKEVFRSDVYCGCRRKRSAQIT